jgi:hypothetical protein
MRTSTAGVAAPDVCNLRERVEAIEHGLESVGRAALAAGPRGGFRVIDGQGTGERRRRNTRPVLAVVSSPSLGA